MNEFLAQFLLESREHVEQAIADLAALEKTPQDRERLDSAFRAFHTLKGGAGIVEFIEMETALHSAEDVLSAVRSGARAMDPEVVRQCVVSLDQVSRWLDVIERTGDLPTLAAGAGGDASAVAGTVQQAPAHKDAQDPPAAISLLGREVLEAQVLLLDEAAGPGLTGRIASAGVVAANVLRNMGRSDAAEHIGRVTEASLLDSAPGGLRNAIDSVLAETASTLSETDAPDTPSLASAAVEPERHVRTLRVDASRIDALVSLTGELTVAKNAIGHAVELSQRLDAEFAALLRRRHAVLDRLVGELQRSVVGLRVLPLRHVFQRFPRLLREMAAAVRKPAELLMEGGETEADKAIVEALFEPILHVLRNAIDHGIESESVRRARGKPAVAAIRLRGERQGEHVIVEVSDDGAGIDVERIREVARARELLSETALDAMSDTEISNLIFNPGFSTSRRVTGLSGRGVGMDAARAAVDRLGGHVAVKSQAGEGTTVRFTLPFSVMMTRVMVVGAAEQTFGIPLDSVVESVRVSADKISPIGSAQAIVLRDRTLPLVELTAALGLPSSTSRETEATIVVTRIDGHYGALRVDRIGARMDVMLKPLEGLLAGMRGLAGSTVLGDGSVLLVIAPAELFH